MAQPIIDSEPFINTLISLIESHLQTVEGTYFTTCTYTPSPTLQPGVVNWKGYTIPTPDEFEKQQKINEERSGGTPPPGEPQNSSPGGGEPEPENETDLDAIFVAGLITVVPFDKQVNTFKAGIGENARIRSFQNTDNTSDITAVLKENPRILIFLFSAGCGKVLQLIDNPDVDKTKLFCIEPWTADAPSRTRIETAISKGMPAKNVFVGNATSRGSNVAGDTSKVPNSIGHLDALKYAAEFQRID